MSPRRKPSVRAHGRLSRRVTRSLGRSRCTRSRRRARVVHGRPRSATDGLDHFTLKGPAAARLVASSSPAGAPRPASHHLAARGAAVRCVDSSPPYTNRLGPRRADAFRVPRHRRQRSNARAETIVAAPTTRGGELRYVRRGSAADDWLEHRALLPGSVCTRARVPHGAFFGCAPRIHVRAVTFRRSAPPARRGGRARAGPHLVRYSAK